ncbi:ATP-binding protein [Lacticaseibacillus absianus]|uniref:ATP-binding protein n=1 Tax=Lacticaseibacillus absianus TaxID=2729623 RepID=UPI0015C9AB62|nr:ATP-binding protein [Lacticaseibacillus absianus]
MDLETTAGRFAALETFDMPCPECGKQLLRPKVLSRETGKKMAGACIHCGYMQPPTERGARAKRAPELQRQARKNKSLAYYREHSVLGNMAIVAKDFHNFVAANDGQQRMLTFAHGVANQIVQGKKIHALLIGTAGTGKSHIANGILLEVMQKSDWKLMCMFVDLPKLIELRKTSIHDGQDDVRRHADDIMHQIGQADVVVIDDLGAERGTEYDVALVDQIFRLREDETTIITTNMTGTQLKATFDERTMSRMSSHAQGNTFAVRGIADQRQEVHG